MAKISINMKTGDLAKSNNTVVGIDLGTTNSLVAYVKDGNAICITDADGKHVLVPSVIYQDEHGSISVGYPAKEKLITFPDATIYSVKRLMGKSFQDITTHADRLHYQLKQDASDGLVKVKLQQTYYTPVELSAIILRNLKERAEQTLKTPVTQAVITVPAYFNDNQRQATRDAGKLAGLDVLRIVNEPTAASLAYGIGLDPDKSTCVAVYDFGGGTFDISILQIESGVFEVLSTHGDTQLGGDDIDAAIVEYWKTHNDTINTLTAKDKAQLRLIAEQAKITLQSQENFSTNLNNIKLTLSTQEFQNIVDPIIQRTLQSCKRAIVDSGKQISELDEIILVGGSTRINYLKEKLKAFFGKSLNDSFNPDEVVALGAAIQADILAGNRKDMLLLDVTPLSMGIETIGGLMDTIIPRNTKVPANFARTYTTSKDGQIHLKIAIYQGERELVKDNRLLAEFILRNIPAMPAGLPKIEIQFLLDADGILKVKASELRSGVNQEIEIRSMYAISAEQMALMLKDSLQHASEDIATRSLIETTTEAQLIIQSSNKFIDQNKQHLTPEEIKSLQDHIQSLQFSIEAQQKDAIQSAMDNLNTYAAPIAHRVMDVNIQQALHGTNISKTIS